MVYTLIRLFKAPYIATDIVRITAYIFKTIPALKFFGRLSNSALPKFMCASLSEGKLSFRNI